MAKNGPCRWWPDTPACGIFRCSVQTTSGRKAESWSACGRDIQRDCTGIERSILTPVYIRTDPAEVQTLLERIAELRNIPVEQARKTILAGTPEEIRHQIQTYIDVGVTHFIVNLRRPGLYDRDAVRIFAKEIMPGFRNK